MTEVLPTPHRVVAAHRAPSAAIAAVLPRTWLRRATTPRRRPRSRNAADFLHPLWRPLLHLNVQLIPYTLCPYPFLPEECSLAAHHWQHICLVDAPRSAVLFAFRILRDLGISQPDHHAARSLHQHAHGRQRQQQAPCGRCRCSQQQQVRDTEKKCSSVSRPLNVLCALRPLPVCSGSQQHLHRVLMNALIHIPHCRRVVAKGSGAVDQLTGVVFQPFSAVSAMSVFLPFSP